MQSFPALYIEAESLAESGASSSSQHASGTPPGAPAFLLELQLSYHSRPACVWVLGGLRSRPRTHTGSGFTRKPFP